MRMRGQGGLRRPAGYALACTTLYCWHSTMRGIAQVATAADKM